MKLSMIVDNCRAFYLSLLPELGWSNMAAKIQDGRHLSDFYMQIVYNIVDIA